MLSKITTDGFCDTLFEDINKARAWCYRYLKNHPCCDVPLEIMCGGEVKGWVIQENFVPVWKKNLGPRYSEYYTLSSNGHVRYVALEVLNGKQLYDACADSPPMDESVARTITRKPTQYGIKNERNVGKIFQVVDTTTWDIVRHGWTFRGVNRYTDRSKEVIIYVPSRRIVKWE